MIDHYKQIFILKSTCNHHIAPRYFHAFCTPLTSQVACEINCPRYATLLHISRHQHLASPTSFWYCSPYSQTAQEVTLQPTSIRCTAILVHEVPLVILPSRKNDKLDIQFNDMYSYEINYPSLMKLNLASVTLYESYLSVTIPGRQSVKSQQWKEMASKENDWQYCQIIDLGKEKPVNEI